MTKFVIGIGSQRAGTTLLHKILDECSPIFMHPVKELHYYDTLFNVRNASVLKDFSKRQMDYILERIIKSPEHGFIDKRYKCNIRTNQILSEQSINEIGYIDLYRPCISDNEYIGEITPEYMILPEEGIKKMRDDLGADTKIILIGRNPVDRLISAFKLLKMYNNSDYNMDTFQTDLEETMQNMPGWMEQQDALNDYATAITNYKKYFNHVLFFSYEMLIENPEVTRLKLQDFLQLDINREQFHKILGKKVNAIGETGSISSEIIQQLNDRYAPILDFLQNFKGDK